MTVYLVRHGETAHNRDGLGLGRADVPLTRTGFAQAKAVAERFETEPVTKVLSSPLSRALTVAEFVAEPHGLVPEVIESLTELDVGETEGLAFAAMRERFPEFLKDWASAEGWRARMPGGESIEDLANRLHPLVEDLLAFEDGDVVVVSHNFTLRVLACQMLGLSPSRFRSFELGLASVSALTVRAGRCWVRSVNDQCHLANLNLA
ncbi:MAG: histidine phosphatase family protein [Dehalococcoidia bacterium]